MRLLVAALFALTPTSKVPVTAAAPTGFTVEKRDGAVFAKGPKGLFTARASEPTVDCGAQGRAQAQWMGRKLLSARDVALRFGRACQVDTATSEGEVLRQLSFRLNAKVNVTVRCLPFDDATAEACMSFAASVRQGR